MNQHQAASSSERSRSTRLIVIYKAGAERKRVLWKQGETLHFPAPLNCMAVRRDGRISVMKLDGAEIFKLSEDRACEDGAEVWVPATGSSTGGRQKFHYIHIQPEVELQLTGVFHHTRAKRKRSSNRTRSIRVEHADRNEPEKRPAVERRPASVARRAVPAVAAVDTRSFWSDLWRLTALAGIGAMAIALIGGRGTAPIRTPALAGSPVAVASHFSSVPESDSKSAFSSRSAGSLKAAIRGAKPRDVAAPSGSQRKAVAH